MTTELEQEFYKTFEIKHATVQQYGASYFLDTIEIDGERYTPIDDRKLLEMICILNETACEVLLAENIEDLKNEILKTCIKVYNTPIITSDGDEYENTAIYDKIQQLFKD